MTEFQLRNIFKFPLQVSKLVLSTLVGILLSILILIPGLIFWIHYRFQSQWYSYKWGKKGYKLCSGYDAVMAHFPKIIINFAIMIPEMPSTQQVHHLMQERIADITDHKGDLRFPKFLQTIEKRDGYCFWKHFPEEKREHQLHIFNYGGKAAKNESELKVILSELHGQPLRQDAPLWQIVLVPLEGDFIEMGIKCCFVTRVHHCLADGISMLRLLVQHLTDHPSKFIAQTALAKARLTHSFSTKVLRVLQAIPNLFQVMVSQFIAERNILHGPELKGEAFCNWKEIDLQVLKDIKNATNTTVNDVLMSCLAGALRRYFTVKNVAVPQTLGAFMPLAMHLPESVADMNNAFSYVALRMCCGIEDPIERLKVSKKTLDAMKKAPDALINYWVLHTLTARLPEKWIKTLGNVVSNSSIFSSNVAGPQEPLYFMGQEIITCFPLLHHHQRTGVGFGLFGYNGKLTVSCSIDKALAENHQETELMLHYFCLEVQQLARLVLQANNNRSK